MPRLVIRLLGRPAIVRDGAVAAPPRGYKAWAVLAYLVLAEHRVSRAQLAGLVFGDADDPLGALRWTLAQLRRSLGVADALRGDPLELGLPTDAVVDVVALASGDPDPGLVRGELLEGVDPGAGEVFDAWLLVERRRLAGACEAVLRDAGLEALAAGAPLDGAALASRALTLNALDETIHELLVRCLARAGEAAAARAHADACDALFRRELGRAPDPPRSAPGLDEDREHGARRPGRWPSSAGRCCCEASCRRRSNGTAAPATARSPRWSTCSGWPPGRDPTSGGVRRLTAGGAARPGRKVRWRAGVIWMGRDAFPGGAARESNRPTAGAGVEQGGSESMTTDGTRRPAGGRTHLRVVEGSEPDQTARPQPSAPPTEREREVMAQVAAQLRRSAARLPDPSALRAELLETAEYFEAGSEASAATVFGR